METPNIKDSLLIPPAVQKERGVRKYDVPLAPEVFDALQALEERLKGPVRMTLRSIHAKEMIIGTGNAPKGWRCENSEIANPLPSWISSEEELGRLYDNGVKQALESKRLKEFEELCERAFDCLARKMAKEQKINPEALMDMLRNKRSFSASMPITRKDLAKRPDFGGPVEPWINEGIEAPSHLISSQETLIQIRTHDWPQNWVEAMAEYIVNKMMQYFTINDRELTSDQKNGYMENIREALMVVIGLNQPAGAKTFRSLSVQLLVRQPVEGAEPKAA